MALSGPDRRLRAWFADPRCSCPVDGVRRGGKRAQPFQARVRPRFEQAAEVLTDLTQLEQVRRRTAMEVYRSVPDRVRRTFTLDERRSMFLLMPDYRRRFTEAQGGTQILGKAEACGGGAVRARA